METLESAFNYPGSGLTMMSSKPSSYSFPLYLLSPSYSISPWNQQTTHSYLYKSEQLFCWARL